MAGAEGRKSERGKFYISQAPEHLSLLTFNMLGIENRVEVPFTYEELRYIRTANDAITTRRSH